MSGLLDGVKVLDLTRYLAGPYCTKLLADLGADVIKIEEPGVGDPTRRMSPHLGDIPNQETSGTFLHLNTNKKSVTANLKSAAGRQIVLELAREADVLVENFSPRVMPGFGLGAETLLQVNPKLVYTSISNFGRSGPYRDYKATELVLYAMGGSMWSTGMPDREPQKLGLSVMQMQTGNVGAALTTGSLLGAMRSGRGQQLDISIMEVVAGSIDRGGTGLLCIAYSGTPSYYRAHTQRMFLMPTGNFPCEDGYVSFFTYVSTWWPRFCAMVGRPDLVDHPLWSTQEGVYDVKTFGDDVDEILYEWLFSHTKREVQEKAQAAGMAAMALNTVEDLLDDPQLQAREFWVKVDHPVAGTLTYPGPSFRCIDHPWQAGRAPLLGEHTAEILTSRLGYSSDDLAILSERGCI